MNYLEVKHNVSRLHVSYLKCKVILADEPTGALDDQTGEQIGDLLLSLVTQDMTLVVATHDLALAKQMDVVIYLKDL